MRVALVIKPPQLAAVNEVRVRFSVSEDIPQNEVHSQTFRVNDK
jgi:hypothetical protein